MSTTRVRIDPRNPSTLPKGRIDPAVVDATTEAAIVLQMQEDDAEAMREIERKSKLSAKADGEDESATRQDSTLAPHPED